MTKDFASKKCVPCEGGVAPLSREEAQDNLKSLKEWRLSDDAKSIVTEYVMKNFITGVDLIHRIAAIAEAEDHHPDIALSGYRNLRVELSTHAIGGLSENDFILAAKIEALQKDLK